MAEQVQGVPGLKVQEEVIQVLKVIPQKRVQQRTVEQILQLLMLIMQDVVQVPKDIPQRQA